MMQAHGYPVGSLTKLTQYFAQLCEKEGAEVYTRFAATELIENAKGRVAGVKIGDKADRDGQLRSRTTRRARRSSPRSWCSAAARAAS